MNSPNRNFNFYPYLTHRMAKPPSSKSLDLEAPQRAGIQSVEVGFGLLQALAASGGPLMLRDLAAAAVRVCAPHGVAGADPAGMAPPGNPAGLQTARRQERAAAARHCVYVSVWRGVVGAGAARDLRRRLVVDVG